MRRIHANAITPQFVNGKWSWDKATGRPEFEHATELKDFHDEYVDTNDFIFRRTLNPLEEYVFRREFQRPDNTHDAEFILVQDIKNLVLFLAPSSMRTKKFIMFIHTRPVHNLFHMLIIYFENFLKVLELVKIRRDETSGQRAQIQSKESTAMKRVYSLNLCQYRLLAAREYRKIVLGEGEMAKFHHVKQLVHISDTEGDRDLHEKMLAFATQVVWIAMHRRAYSAIDEEMGRLFRSEHFMLRKPELQFTISERELLFGKNCKNVNYRYQNSPITQEFLKCSSADSEILWLGRRKYRGTNQRMYQLEMEVIVPESQLCLIGIVHGILGHPKKIYNTILELEWEAAREEKYNTEYDPYQIFQQPSLKIPKMNEELIRERAETFFSSFEIKREYEQVSEEEIEKWRKQDAIMENYKKTGVVLDIYPKAALEIESDTYGPSSTEVIDKFMKDKKLLRKN